ncbi:hypothetical protein, partial [Zavarzinella formosa]|uniref:hypothetical protein n=1 Tax=Zavarzinella formosa TaxID=360055 RepID=UPI00187DB0CB
AESQFAAAVALGGDNSLGLFLDHSTEHLRTWAVLVQLLLELRGTTGMPSRVLACLSAKAPRTRLGAAGAPEAPAGP